MGMTRLQGMGIYFGENMGVRVGMVGSAHKLGDSNLRDREEQENSSSYLALTHLSLQRYLKADHILSKLSTTGAKFPGLQSSMESKLG